MRTCRSEALLAAVETVCRSLGDSGVHPAHASSLDVARVLGCGVAEGMVRAVVDGIEWVLSHQEAVAGADAGNMEKK